MRWLRTVSYTHLITNDIYTKEDAEFLCKNSIMPKERILGVETGGSVSYTHLDVYKRQVLERPDGAARILEALSKSGVCRRHGPAGSGGAGSAYRLSDVYP